MGNGRLDKEEVLRRLGGQMPRLRREYAVKKLALYGSFANGRPRPDSDVDIIVDLRRPLGLEFVEMAQRLEKELGRRVDITTFASLRRSRNHRRFKRAARAIERSLVNVE